MNVFATGTFFHCARKILHEQERSTCLEAAAKGKSDFLSQHLTFQSVLAFLDVDPKKYTEQGTLLSAQFSSWKRVPKSSSSPGTETGPRFWLSSSKIQAHAIRGPKLELRLGTHFWGPIMPVFFSSRSHIWSLCSKDSKVNKTLRSSVLLHHAGVPLKLKVVSGTRGNM